MPGREREQVFRRPRILNVVTTPYAVIFKKGQLAAMRKAGFEVYLVSSPGEQLTEAAKREGAASFAVPMKREIAPLHDLLSLYRLIRLYLRIKPEISNVGTPKAGLLGGIAAWLTRVPCRVYNLNGLRLETTRGFKRMLLKIAEKISCACAHIVLCDSSSLRELVLALRLAAPDRVLVLGSGSANGIDLKKFTPNEQLRGQVQQLRERLDIPAGAPVIGFVGRLTRDKGINELIAAYHILKLSHPSLRLLLVGDFESGNPVSKQTRATIELDHHVKHTGFVEDPVPYYYLMHVFAFPTYREGFGNVSIEAAAAGLPVVATRVTGAIDSVVEGKSAWVVPPGDPSALALALRQLLDNPELAKRMGAYGRTRAQEQFASERIWAELASLYQKMLADRRK